MKCKDSLTEQARWTFSEKTVVVELKRRYIHINKKLTSISVLSIMFFEKKREEECELSVNDNDDEDSMNLDFHQILIEG